MLNRKSQGLPLNIIIIAVVVLIVLIVIIAIFAGRIRVLPTGVQSCEGRGGSCQKESCTKLNMAPIMNHDCTQVMENRVSDPDEYKYCCIQVTE